MPHDTIIQCVIDRGSRNWCSEDVTRVKLLFVFRILPYHALTVLFYLMLCSYVYLTK